VNLPNQWNSCPATWTAWIQQRPLLDALKAKNMVAGQVSNHVLDTDLIVTDVTDVALVFNPILKINESKQECCLYTVNANFNYVIFHFCL
jgi:hypothetical protein